MWWCPRIDKYQVRVYLGFVLRTHCRSSPHQGARTFLKYFRISRIFTIFESNNSEKPLTILGNGKGSTTIPLAGVGTLGPGTKHPAQISYFQVLVLLWCLTHVVVVESPKKFSHFLSVVLRMLTMPSLSPHCLGWLTKVRGS